MNIRSNEQFNCRNTTLENPLEHILLYGTDYGKRFVIIMKNQNNLDYNVYYNSKDLFKKREQFKTVCIYAITNCSK
jgi:hypothetical protein